VIARGIRESSTGGTFEIFKKLILVTVAAVHFGQGVKSPAKVGDHVTVSGTVTEYSTACSSTTPTITTKTVAVSS
jgi:hypothetical protein